MPDRPSLVERAFELARSGDYASITALRDQLRAEGYNQNLLEGPTLLKQLRELIRSSYRPPPELSG